MLATATGGHRQTDWTAGLTQQKAPLRHLMMAAQGLLLLLLLQQQQQQQHFQCCWQALLLHARADAACCWVP